MGIFALGLFIVVVIAGFAYAHASATKLRTATWESLVAQIAAVPLTGIAAVALDNLQPKENQIELEPDDMWQMLGGTDGLDKMRRNADTLIALAAYVQRWNYTEATVVAERMRRDAMQLKRATRQIRTNLYFHRKAHAIPFHLHEAATAYHLMTQRLLALYQRSHVGLYPRLAESLSF